IEPVNAGSKEGRLGQIHLPCDLLHPGGVARVVEVADRRRIAGERLGSKGVDVDDRDTHSFLLGCGYTGRVRRLSFLILVAATLGSSSPRPDADPAQNLARVRVIVVTTAATTDVTVSGATILSYISSVLAGPDGARTSRTGQTLRLSQNSPGQSAEAQFDAILGSVPSDGTLAWNLATSSNVETSLELY